MAQIYRLNKSGRTYTTGRALFDDMRARVTDNVLNEGPSCAQTGRELAILDRTATKIVDYYAAMGDNCPKDLKTGRSRLSKVSFGDQMLMETLINTSGPPLCMKYRKRWNCMVIAVMFLWYVSVIM